MPVELRLLGPPEVWVEGQRVELPTRKLLALLAYLALEGNTPRARLAELLWDTDDERARGNLRGELYRLKKTPLASALNDENRELRLEGLQTDLARFAAYLGQNRWAEALELRRGVLLEGLHFPDAPLFEEWLELTRETWEEKHREALHRHAEALEREGAARAALERYQQLLRLDPLREEAQRALMRLYERLGEPALALESYARYANFLEKELGLAPVKETRLLAEQIRSGGTPPATALKAGALSGRKREWRVLEEAWRAGKTVFIAGEPGVGKTRLMLDFMTHSGLQPALIVGRPGDVNVPFSTITRLLRRIAAHFPVDRLEPWIRRELSRLMPELGEPPPPMRSEEDRLRLFEAITTFTLKTYTPQQARGTDDMQFYDDASIEVLAYQAAQQSHVPLLVAYRKGELSAQGEALVRGHLDAELGVMLELGPLEAEGVREMLWGMGLGIPAEPLYRYTGGNPLFVLETVQSLSETGKLTLPAEQLETEWKNLPRSEKVQGLIRRRLERLSPGARDLARLAAIANQSFGEPLAAQVLGLSPLRLAEAGDELEAAGILRKGRFLHDLLYEATLESLSDGVRTTLHRQVAEALEGTPAPPVVIAEHYERGAEPLRAVPHRLRAAEAAADIYVYREALEHYYRAFADAESDPLLRLEAVVQSAEIRYRMCLALSDWEAMTEDLRLTEEANRVLQNPMLANQIELGWADRAFRTGAFNEALARCEQLLAQDNLTPDQTALTHYTAAVSLLNLNRLAEAEAGCRAALQTRPGPDWVMHGWVQNSLAICLLYQGQLALARQHNNLALEHFQTRADGQGLANALRVAGLVVAEEGQTRQAQELLEEALTQARRVGHRVLIAFALQSLAQFHLRAGHIHPALELAQEGLAQAQAANDPHEGGIWHDLIRQISQAQPGAANPPSPLPPR